MDLFDCSAASTQELRRLKKAIDAELRSREVLPDNSELYERFTTTYTSMVGTLDELDLAWADPPLPHRPRVTYVQPTFEEFEVLIKTYKTAAKTEKGIQTWMTRAWRGWCATLVKAEEARLKIEKAKEGLIYRLANEVSFPKSIQWTHPTPIAFKKRVAESVRPGVRIKWTPGMVTAYLDE